MNTLRALFHRCIVAGVIISAAVILLAQPVNAQRPSIADLQTSIADLQAQMDGLQGPLDTPEAQVRTALDILPVFQEAVARSFHKKGEAPANRTEAGLTSMSTDTNTTFITSVNIQNGTIIVTFGNYADASITGQTLTFTPYESSDLTVVWRCGADPVTPGTALLGTAGGGTTAFYTAPTIPPSTYPDPCILTSQPGSQADVVRAQVRTTLDILPVFQEAVARSFKWSGEAPASRTEAGLTAAATDTQTNYISSVGIQNGTIIVTYGNEANLSIAGHFLTFTPYESVDQTIVWRCGNDPAPANASLLGTSGGGTTASYVAPTILWSQQPDPCILRLQPGSQDDVIQAQVLEPFDVVETIQDAVEVAGATLGSSNQPIPPINRTEAGLTAFGTDTVGLYFYSVDVYNGTIVITYGNQASLRISGETLSLTPYESADGTIVWRCGLAPYPAGTVLMGTSAGSVVASYVAPSPGMLAKYLPPNCRF